MRRQAACGTVTLLALGVLAGCGGSGKAPADAATQDADDASVPRDGATVADSRAGDDAARADDGPSTRAPTDAGAPDGGATGGDGCASCDAGGDVERAEAGTDGAKAFPVSVGVGLTHACALMSDGSVRCWGDNSNGALGDGTLTTSSKPVEVRLLGAARVVSVAAARSATCALIDTGRVSCWGRIDAIGLTPNPAPAAKDVGVEGATALVATRERMCALVAGGHARCWGDTSQDELGAPSTLAQPSEVVGLAEARAIAMGFHQTCVIRAGGQVACWGGGVRTTGVMNVPGLTGAVAVSAAAGRSCAETGDGVVHCWNDDEHAETTPGWVPAPVDGLRGVSSLAGTCGLFAGGAVACLGQVSVFTVSLANPALTIAADGEARETCAITKDHEVWCWQPLVTEAPARVAF